MPASVRIDFLVPGFSKCGTTTLCQLLSCHPDIYIPPAKELWYFSSDNYESHGSQYDDHFAPAGPGQLKGEGSVSYSGYEYEDIAIARIYENNPECRFIFIARNPRQRIESSYRQMHHSGVQFGLNAPFALGSCLEAFPQMVNDTLYWQRISKYRRRFGDDAILVVFLEDLQENTQACLRRCFEHLGIAPDISSVEGEVRLNEGQFKLHDTRLLRFLRATRAAGRPLARMGSYERQDRLLVPLRLRRTFGRRAIDWDAASLLRYRRDIYPDAQNFLEFYG
jgi:hypothetical protein